MEALIKIEALIDLLFKYITSEEKICKDIQETISGDSSEKPSEENLLSYYETIPSEEKSLVYACLAKILNLKEYLLSKDIEKIAESWMMIKLDNIKVDSKTDTDKTSVKSESFWVPYVINNDGFAEKIAKYMGKKFSGKLGKCLKLTFNELNQPIINKLEEEINKLKEEIDKLKEEINKLEKGKEKKDKEKEKKDKEKEKKDKEKQLEKQIEKITDKEEFDYNEIDKLLKKIAGKIEQPALEPYMSMARTGNGKTFCEVPSQIAERIYEAWNNEYNKENNLGDEEFLKIFSEFDNDINTFFKAFRIGVDCSGYVNQVYGQWMLDLYTQRKLKTDEIQTKMIETIGANKTKCRDNCLHIREEEAGNKKYSLYHIGYFFPIDEIKNKQPKSINIWNRKKNGDISVFTKVKKEKGKEYETIDMSTVNEVVKSNLKAGDLISFVNNNKKGAHYAIVEKTGVNEQGQWYFCITESTEADKVGWKDLKTGHIYKKDEDKKPWDGVRNDQGYYTSIEDFMKLRQSQYEFFWFCRPKAIDEYYDNNNIIEYKENES